MAKPAARASAPKPEHKPGRGRIYDSITDTIGDTPLVRLNNIASMKNVRANLLAKLEFFNPISSVKDRIGVAMIDALLENVFAHTNEHIPLAIRLGAFPDGSLRLAVEDGGTGIANSDAVDRGASTGDSSGLGLDIVRRTAEASGGSLELTTSARLGGACVVVRLPKR